MTLVDGERAKKDWEDSNGDKIKFNDPILKTDGDKGNVLTYNVKKEYFEVRKVVEDRKRNLIKRPDTDLKAG